MHRISEQIVAPHRDEGFDIKEQLNNLMYIYLF